MRCEPTVMPNDQTSTMNYQNVRFFVVVGNTTREPTEAEARAIVTYLGSGQRSDWVLSAGRCSLDAMTRSGRRRRSSCHSGS
jgi:hypothetical protein